MMLYTTKQIDEGITDILTLDMEQYAKKNETATKEELNGLTEVVAGKLDSTPMHHHDIQHIDELQNQLSNKLNSDQKYSYNTLISDPEKIDYLEKLTTDELSIGVTHDGVLDSKFTIDTNSVNDLVIKDGDVTVGTYVKSTNTWNMNGITDTLVEHADVLDNHREAIELLNTQTYEALDGKAPIVHEHAISDITDLQTTLDGKSNTTHSHSTFQSNGNDPYNNITQHLAPSITDGNCANVLFGKAHNPNECGYIGFRYATDINNRCINFGQYSANNLLQIYPNRIETTLPITTTANINVNSINNRVIGYTEGIYCIPQIRTDTVMNVGKYIDFYDLGATNYTARLNASSTSLTCSKPLVATNLKSDNETRLASLESRMTALEAKVNALQNYTTALASDHYNAIRELMTYLNHYHGAGLTWNTETAPFFVNEPPNLL